MSKFRAGEEVVLVNASVIPEMVGAIGEVILSDSHINGRVIVQFKDCLGVSGNDLWHARECDLLAVKRFNGEMFAPKSKQRA